MARPIPTEQITLQGHAGKIDALLDQPKEAKGIALVCHPHPLYDGANTNKVAFTLARAFRDLGYAVIRPNFRGVGESEGEHDKGQGETDDMLSVIAWAQQNWGTLPLALGGFSFGSYVQTRVAEHLADSPTPAERIVLVGTVAGTSADGEYFYEPPALPENVSSLLIHGEKDDTALLENAFRWAEPQQHPVVVVPGADHFFHARLHIIRQIISGFWTKL